MEICVFTRRDRPGRNVAMTWADFCHRVDHPRITGETMAEYSAMSKSEKTDVKDVGGFVGGSVRDGRRKRENIETRQLVALDMDYCAGDFERLVAQALDGHDFVLIPTHSSNPRRPRRRLIFPLARPVEPDEYEPIARKIADRIGIEMFDDTTFQPERLMFWPSIPSDLAYDPLYGEGTPIEPAEVLAEFKDWKDVREWPVSSRRDILIDRAKKKQADPLEKSGFIGAFCRTYSIQDAIATFLSDVYSSCGDRYTYINGTTTAGVVVYEDKFAYSNHASDPAGGQLLNAFDLVRVHKFGLMDEDVENVPANRRPSYKAMMDLIKKDDAVKVTAVSERVGAVEDFALELNQDWMKELSLDKSGKVSPTIANVELILENDPNLSGRCAFDLLRMAPAKLKPFQWDGENFRQWTDNDDAQIKKYLEKGYGVSSGVKIMDALTIVQHNHSFHPIRDYLNPLVWDGIPRVETLLIDYVGADDTEMTRVFTKKALTAAVARVMEPGCKWDYMPLLIGEQGAGKSNFLSLVFKGYSSDTLVSIGGKEGYEALDGVWCVEMSEMAAAKKADIEAMKQYVSKCSDRYRKAYDRRVGEYPRQCVFFGTTNDRDCLKDYTGNRRFWPIMCARSRRKYDPYVSFTDDIRDQVWAEAVQCYKDGENLFLTDEQEAKARALQNDHTLFPDRWSDYENFLETPIPANHYTKDLTERTYWYHQGAHGGEILRTEVCAKELWMECMGGTDRTFTMREQKDIRECLLRLGWEPRRVRIPGYGGQRGFVRVRSGILAESQD